MAIGNVPGSAAQLNYMAGSVAARLRDVMNDIVTLGTWVNKQDGTAMQNLGFTAPDASQITAMCDYMLTISGVYYGTVQQGGSGGTGAGTFNFADALTALTGPT